MGADSVEELQGKVTGIIEAINQLQDSIEGYIQGKGNEAISYRPFFEKQFPKLNAPLEVIRLALDAITD